MTTDVIVIGAGVVGLSTAWRLAQRGCRVRVIEQFSLGHARGSSHGAARITRSTYAQPTYVRLVALAHAQDWPELEAECQRPLVLRGGDAVIWGPEDGAIGAYADAALSAATATPATKATDVLQLDVAEARRRFPAMLFPDAERVLWDRTAGVVSAAATMEALASACRRRGVEIIEHAHLEAYAPTASGVSVRIQRADGAGRALEADALVLAAGPWSSATAGIAATPVRQDVGYWRLPGARAGRFPCFIHLGAAAVAPGSRSNGAVHYGLPGIDEDMLKAALHRTSGTPDNPDEPRLEADPVAIAAVGERLRQWFRDLEPGASGALARTETCFYTNTPTEDFVLDVLKADGAAAGLSGASSPGGRIVIGAGLSGHGFKFGPLLGRILADLVLDGTSAVAPFAEDRARFAVRRR